MSKFLITDVVSKASTIVCLEEASRITELDPDEILWALEEEGICETDRHVVADYAEPSVNAAARSGPSSTRSSASSLRR